MVWSAAMEGVYCNKRADRNAEGTYVSKDTDPYSIMQPKNIVLSKRDNAEDPNHTLPTIDAPVLLGRTFINDPDKTGEQTQARIENVKPIGRYTPDGKQELFRFRARAGEKTFENIMTYNKMLEWCDRDLDKDDFFRIEGIIGHWKEKEAGRGYVVLVQWADGTSTWNDLGMT